MINNYKRNNYSKHTYGYNIRLIALVLVFTIILSSVFTGGLSASAETVDNAVASENIETTIPEEPYIIGEDIERRGENEKHFLMSDGTRVATMYDTAVHYLDESGEYQEIDNSFESSDEEYQTKKGKNKVKLAKKASAKKLVTLHTDDYKISWGFEGAEKVKAQVVEDNNETDEEFAVKNINGKMKYANAFENIDLEYIVKPDGIKENIILKSADAQNEFVVNYDVGKLVAVQKDSRTIDLVDGETVKYTISAPVMIDANNKMSTDLSITLTEQKNGKLTVILSADSEWLSTSERAYPVTVDPGLTDNQSAATLDCKFTFSADPDTISNINDVYNTSAITLCGFDSVLEDTTSLYSFKSLPNLSAGDYITSASFVLLGDKRVGFQINLYECFELWTGEENYAINYEPAYNDELIDFCYFENASNAPTTYSWNITNLVRNWYKYGTIGLNNCGFILRPDMGLATNYVRFFSVGYATTTIRPTLVINYVNHTGIEDYYSYTTADVGAGTAYVDNSTGNLTVALSVLNNKGANMPANVSLYYNGTQSGKHSNNIIGAGWRLNYDQRVDYVEDSAIRANGYDYVYTDADGTMIYMKKTNTAGEYTDELGLGFKLKITSSQRVLTDKSENQVIFDSTGKLISIKSPSSSSLITCSYTTTGKLDKVTDGSGDIITFERNSNNVITKIIDPYGREITLGYSGSKLISITGFDEATVAFAYNANNYLTCVTSADNLQTKFMYSNSIYPMVNSRVDMLMDVSQPDESGSRTDGDWLTLFYSYEGYTVVSDSSVNDLYYVFDELGRAKNSFSEAGATSQTFTTPSNDNATYTNNKIEKATGTTKPTNNVAKDNNFESTGNWYTWTSSNASASLSTECARLGKKSVKLTAENYSSVTYYQHYSPTVSGDYTYSVYYKTEGVIAQEGISALIAMVDYNGNKTYKRSRIMTTSTSGEWERLTVTATIDIDVIKEIHIINALHYANGSVYFDCAQLEFSDTTSEYNMLYNGYFNNGSTGWSSNVVTREEGVQDIGSVIYAGNEPTGFPKSFVMMGDRVLNRYVVQTVEINQPANKVALNFSAYAHAQACKSDNGCYYALDLNFIYTDGTSEYIWRNFNIQNRSWQYLTELFTPSANNMSKTVEKVRAYFIYYGQANYAEVTGMQLTVDTTGMMYSYDEKGNPISALDTQENQVESVYDEQNRLNSKTMQDGSVYTINYGADTTNRLPLSTTGPKDQKTDYTYNTYGQILSESSYNATETDGLKTTKSFVYSNDGKYLDSQADALGNTTTYSYDEYDRQNLTYYSDDDMDYLITHYDNSDRVTSMARARNDMLTSFVNVGYKYTNNRLSSIIHNRFNYNFEYDKFGNTTKTSVGNQPLITNTFSAEDYNPDNDDLDTVGLLTKSTYGNGDYVEYDYDRYGRIVGQKYNGVVKCNYKYNSSGNIDKIIDYDNNVTYNYYYDGLGRLNSIYCTNKFGITYKFDGSNRTTDKTYTYNGIAKTTHFTYDAGGFLNTATFTNGSNRAYSYDSLARVSSIATKTSENATNSWNTTYGYLNPTANTTTAIINSVNHTNANLNLTYEYDKFGYVIAVKENGVLKASYEYDNLYELTRENNLYTGKTVTYEYDNGGNILSKTTYDYTTGSLDGLTGTVVQYTYGDNNWKDKLTAYNGNSITYDEIGNPITYYNGNNLEWDKGRSLIRVNKPDGTYMSYKYNESGIRTRKTVNGTPTFYFLDGNNIIAQQTENTTYWFDYDATGNRHSMEYNGNAYYYYYNLQGDVIGLYDSDLNIVVNYTYDSWGKVLSITGSMADTLGQANPFRYRGYYYDSESDLYYLNSRYYDPEVGRFINADGYASTGQGLLGSNMFAYCENNPINLKDPTGQFWITALIVTAVVAVCTVTLSGCLDKPDPAPLPYKTADEAAMAFANSTYSSSRYIRHEYGTVIYSSTTKGTTTYDFATPVTGNPHSVGYGNVKIPSGTKKVATAHTHPNSNSFSGLELGATSGDIPNAISRGLDSYVIGPNLNLQKYSISSGEVSVVGSASPVALTDQQQSALVSQFQISWDNHLGTCAFGCEHMTWPTS